MRNGLFFCVLALLGMVSGCGSPPRPAAPAEMMLQVAVPREPSTWNRLLATEIVTQIVTDQLHAPLIRLNQETQQMEPALAESWEFSDDDREIVFHLRQGVRFSDGVPFTAADVVFTFRALWDPRVASPLVDTAEIDGQALVPEALDEETVRFPLTRRTASVERIFDSIRILPRHRLEDSLERGALAEDTGLGAPIENIVGLGPFRLREHLPGQRVVLERNPHYFGSPKGLPRLPGIVFEVLPDTSAQILRLRAGEVDLVEPMAPEVFRELSENAATSLVMKDLGPSMVSERLWFNLNPESPIEAHKRAWFQDVRFRRAVSLAIDRKNLARVVFDGLASPAIGPVSPANRFWRNEELEPMTRDVERARNLLKAAGFRWKTGKLYDRAGHRVRFTIATNSGSDQRRREAAFVQEDLAQLGIEAVLTPLEGAALFSRVTTTFDYEVCLLGFTSSDPDPSAEMAFWLSRGPLHLWHPSQAEPETQWEARIDELMTSQMSSVDREHRKACYDEVQRIVREQLPIIDLVVPHELVGHHERLQGVRATPFSHSLWNSEELSIEYGKNTTTPESVTQVTDSWGWWE